MPGRPYISLLAVAAVLAGCGSTTKTSSSASRTVIDSNGVRVSVPVAVKRVVTVGPVPVLNSFVLALGEGATIVNGVPPDENFREPYESTPAGRRLKGLPIVQNAADAPIPEEVLGLKPSVVLTMFDQDVKPLTSVGLKVVNVQWTTAADIQRVMTLLGTVFGVPSRAVAYEKVFDGILQTVRTRLAAVPKRQAPSALFMVYGAPFTQPYLIADWWIAQAGGRSVTANGRLTDGPLAFTPEQLLRWNPKVIFVETTADAKSVMSDPRLANLAAVQAKRVYATPPWYGRTSETPLMVPWAASKLYPRAFSSLNLPALVQRFYADVFGAHLSTPQADSFLAPDA